MKGTFFQRPLELNLIIEGETWQQGDAVTGTLIAKNHGADPIPAGDIHVDLAYGDLKKVRQKRADAFKVLSSARLDTGSDIAPRADAKLEWKFQTDKNSPITDKSASLFALYGRGSATEQLGQLQLIVQPYQLIEEFLYRFKTDFRFIEKGRKSAKGCTEVKLAPPSAKSFATLDHLVIHFRFEGDTLQLRYVFNVKAIAGPMGISDVKKQKRELTQELGPADYRTSTGRVNHDRLEAAIREAVATVESKIAF